MDRDRKKEGGLWFRDLLMTAGSATDLESGREMTGAGFPKNLLTPLSTCACFNSGISTCCLAGEQSPFALALALPGLFSHHLGFEQCT